MLNPSLEPDIDRLSALYSYGLIDNARDPVVEAVTSKIAEGFGSMSVQCVLVDDNRLWIAASAGPALDECGRQGSLAGAAIEQIEPLVVDDLQREARLAQSPSVVSLPHLRTYAAVTIRTPENFAIGVLAVSDTIARRFRAEHIDLLQRGAAKIVDRIDVLRAVRTDPSSGALDAAAFRQQVRALLAVASRHRRPLSVLAIDIRPERGQTLDADFGRVVVDRIGGLGRNRVRRLDSFGRLEEGTFAVLLPNTDETGARSLGQRLFDSLHDERLPSAGFSFMQAGVGIASFRPGLDQGVDLVVHAVRNARRPWQGGQAQPGTPRVA